MLSIFEKQRISRRSFLLLNSAVPGPLGERGEVGGRGQVLHPGSPMEKLFSRVVLSQPEPEEPSPLRQEAEEAGGGRDGVSHRAECCAAETAVINSGGASAEGLLGVGLQLSVICE